MCPLSSICHCCLLLGVAWGQLRFRGGRSPWSRRQLLADAPWCFPGLVLHPVLTPSHLIWDEGNEGYEGVIVIQLEDLTRSADRTQYL